MEVRSLILALRLFVTPQATLEGQSVNLGKQNTYSGLHHPFRHQCLILWQERKVLNVRPAALTAENAAKKHDLPHVI
jgi:hypothetical protein